MFEALPTTAALPPPKHLRHRTREAETLRAGLERAQGILTKAQRLVSQLGGEQQRWQDQAMSLSDALSTLPLKMLLAAGFATYLVRCVDELHGGVFVVQSTVCGAPGWPIFLALHVVVIRKPPPRLWERPEQSSRLGLRTNHVRHKIVIHRMFPNYIASLVVFIR